jgi:hypothetical protein
MAVTTSLVPTCFIGYKRTMHRAVMRQILAIVLSVVLATGLVLHSAYAGGMGMNSSAAMSSDMPMPGGCDRCNHDGKGIAPGLCAAYCSTIVAVATPTLAYYPVPGALMTWPPDLPPVSRGEPPDPYPPRSAGLS